MNLRDEQIVLRAIEETDCEILLEMINSPEMEKLVLGWSFPVSQGEQKRWIAELKNSSNCVRYIVEYQGDAVGMAIISDIDFKNSNANISVKFVQRARNQGIGTKTLRLLSDYCFNELNLHCLTAQIMEKNVASQRLYEKCGYKKEGTLRSRIYKNGIYNNVFVYSLLKDEF